MVVPSLPALFASATTDLVLVGQLLRNEGPTFGTIACNQIHDGIVLWLIPELALARVFAFLDVLASSGIGPRLAHFDP